MTNEEREQAIAILENEKKCVNRANKNDYCNRDYYNCELVKTDTEMLTALEMAIKALEQEPSGDLISRQAVMDCFKKWKPYMATRLWDFEQELSKLPSVVISSKDTETQGDDRWLLHFGQNKAIPSAELQEIRQAVVGLHHELNTYEYNSALEDVLSIIDCYMEGEQDETNN